MSPCISMPTFSTVLAMKTTVPGVWFGVMRKARQDGRMTVGAAPRKRTESPAQRPRVYRITGGSTRNDDVEVFIDEGLILVEDHHDEPRVLVGRRILV